MKKRLFRAIGCLLLAVCFPVISFAACSANGDSAGSDAGADSNTEYRADWYKDLSGDVKDFYFIDSKSNTISREFTDTSATVEAGAHVKLTTPLAIDGAGNLLKVTVKVFTAAGDEVATVSGGFFALSKAGYSIKFGVCTLDGQTHEFKKTVAVNGAENLYFGDRLTVDIRAMFSALSVKFIDVKGEGEYYLPSMFDEEQLQIYTENKRNKTVKWKLVSILGKIYELTGETIDFSVYGTGAYVVAAYTENDTFDDTFFVSCVDFFDFSGDIEWNEITDDTEKVLLSASENTALSVVEFEGKKAYKVESGLGDGLSEAYSFKLMPKHSLAYYSLFAEEEYLLKFDVYAESDTPIDRTLMQPVEDGTVTAVGYEFLGARGQNFVNKWNTYTLNLNDYGTTWDSFISIEDIFYFSTAQYPGTWGYAGDSTVYFADFRLEKTGGEKVYGKQVAIDVNDRIAVRLENYLDAELKNQVNGATDVEYVLSADGEEITTDGIISVSDLKMRKYNVKVLIAGAIVGTSEYDFYNSAEEFVFAEVSDNYSASGATVVTQPAPESVGMGGTVYKIETGNTRVEFNPAYNHGKAYYEFYRDYMVLFELYIATEADSATFKIAGETYSGGFAVNKRIKVALSVEDFVSSFETFSLFEFHGETVTGGIKDAPYAQTLTVYLGGFSAALIPEKETEYGGVTVADETAGEINLNTLVGAATKNYLEQYADYVSYEISDNYGNSKRIYGGIVSFADLGIGNYKVVIKVAEETVYEGRLSVLSVSGECTTDDIFWQETPWQSS